MAYHDEYVELISAAIDGALSPAEQAKLDQHLAACPHCQALYEDLNRVHQTLQALPTAGVPAGLTDRVITAVKGDNVTPLPVKKPAFQWKRWAATAAILALILAGAGGMGLLTERDIMAPASNELATPESVDPAMARSLPVGGQTTPEAAVLPTGGVQTGTEDDQSPVSQEDLTTQGADPVPTAEPTQYVVQTTPEPTQAVAPMFIPVPSPAETPEEGEEVPTGNLSVGPLGQMPIIPVPSASATPDGQEEAPEIGVMSVGLEEEMTEAELAAMEQVRLYLELPEDYVWEDGVTCLWADEETTLRLTYLGLDAGGLCYMFDLSEDTLLYLVPVAGGEIITAEP